MAVSQNRRVQKSNKLDERFFVENRFRYNFEKQKNYPGHVSEKSDKSFGDIFDRIQIRNANMRFRQAVLFSFLNEVLRLPGVS